MVLATNIAETSLTIDGIKARCSCCACSLCSLCTCMGMHCVRCCCNALQCRDACRSSSCGLHACFQIVALQQPGTVRSSIARLITWQLPVRIGLLTLHLCSLWWTQASASRMPTAPGQGWSRS